MNVPAELASRKMTLENLVLMAQTAASSHSKIENQKQEVPQHLP